MGVIQKTIAFGLNADTRRIEIKREWVERIDITVRRTITDASISAGENTRGAITRVVLGSERRNLLPIERDQIGQVVDFLKPGTSNGYMTDADPVTATADESRFVLSGPFDFSVYKEEAPYLELSVNAAGEWATASAAVLSFDVEVVYGDPSPGQIPRRLVKYTKPSQTDFDVEYDLVDQNVLLAILMITSANNPFTYVDAGPALSLPAGPGSMRHTYQGFKEGSTITETRHLVAPGDDTAEPLPIRGLLKARSAATTLEAWFMGGVIA